MHLVPMPGFVICPGNTLIKFFPGISLKSSSKKAVWQGPKTRGRGKRYMRPARGNTDYMKGTLDDKNGSFDDKMKLDKKITEISVVNKNHIRK